MGWQARLVGKRVPLWIKIVYSLYLCVLVPAYWREYGPTNFLWASDIALFVVFAAVWLESPLLNSMMVIGVLPFELAWIVDFFAGSQLIGMAQYMFDVELPLFLRLLSLFHIMLPIVMIYLLCRLGYDRRALIAQTLLCWLVLPATYLLTKPVDNINLVYGLGMEPQTLINPLLYLGLQMIFVPIIVFIPAHLVIQHIVRSW